MSARPEALQALIDALAGALLVGRGDFQGRDVVQRIAAAAHAGSGGIDMRPAPDLPVLSHLGAVFASARKASGTLGRVADALSALRPVLPWRQRPTLQSADARFAAGHANVTIVGPGGIEARNGFWIGASLVAPGISHPDHSHPPEEVYLLLSPGSFRHGEEGFADLAAGDTFHNLPGIVHTMRAGAEPLLAIWFLWQHDD